MDLARWERLSAWHNSWLAADASGRELLRARLAADQPDLLADADALATASLRLDRFLDTPALALAARTLAEEDPLLATDTLVGPYRIVGLLARGGMGDLYRASDTRLRRDVALKMLVPSRSGDRLAVERFLQEAQVTASLDHPNVVRIYDVGWHDGRVYLIAELLAGETLRARIERGPIPAAEVCSIGAQIANGLVAAHAAGLVHRDLKPENVFLLHTGETKILDFGIAKLAQEGARREGLSTHTGLLLGTAGYLSPEQVRGLEVDARADLFALGAVLFEMLTGKRAFQGECLVDTLHAITHDPPSADLAEAQGIPPSLAAIVERLLEKPPEKRFQSASEVVAALEQARAGGGAERSMREGVRERSSRQLAPSKITSPRRATAAARRHRVAISSVGAAAVMAVVAMLAWRLRDAPREQPVADATRTLAVFPFRSLPSGDDAELLELGLADVLISRLGRLPGVHVLPLTATQRLRDEDPRKAGRRLDADWALTGLLQRDGERLRASVQLLSVVDDRTIWADTVDSAASGVFGVQDAIVERVVEEVAPELSPDARREIVTLGTRSSEAFAAYLSGRAHVLRPNPRDLGQAAELFRQALALDPKYADAWAGLAAVYRLLPMASGSETRPRDAYPEAKDAAQRALEIDSKNAEALAVLGNVAFWYDWDYPRAEELLRQSLALRPDSSFARSLLAHLLSNLGRHTEAIEQIRRARQHEPSYLVAQGLEIQVLFFARRYDEALRAGDAMVHLEPHSPNARIWRVYPLLALGRYEEAIGECEAGSDLLARLVGGDHVTPWSWAEALRGFALARLGRRPEAEAALATLQTRARQRYVPPHHVALVLHALGRDAEAFAELRQGLAERDVFVTFLGVDPKWDELRADSAFREIVSAAGLREVSDAAPAVPSGMPAPLDRSAAAEGPR